jgi:hypothetical protein
MKRSDAADLERTFKPRRKPYKPRGHAPPGERRDGAHTICDTPSAGACNTLYTTKGTYKPRNYVGWWDRSPYMHNYIQH